MSKPLFEPDASHVAQLLDLCPVVADAIVSKPLVNVPHFKQVLFAMDEGQEISDHSAPFLTVVQVLEGRLDFAVGARGGETRHDMGPHAWLLMPPNEPHNLRALAPTRFLLTFFKGQPA